MTSLINTVRSKFLNAIRSVNPPGRWKILVVDEHSQQLLGSVLKQFDVLEENVTLIESITNYREPQPGFEAMYLLMSTTENVERIIRDFSDGRQQYAGAHLFFIDGLSEHLFERLTSSSAEPHLKTLLELFINFWALEAQAFSLKLPGSFFNMYSPPRSDSAFPLARARLEEELRFASKMIANVCITLNEFPYIRYYLPTSHPPLGAFKPHASTRAPPPPENSGRWRTQLARGADARAYESADTDFVAKVLAFMVQSDLDDYKKTNPDFGKTADAQRPRSTMIITDRSMDTIAPFVHEFTYQAMANDLLPIDDGTRYTYKFQAAQGAFENKTAILSDADNVWTELRHMHMREAIDKLMADFNQFMQDNAGFKGEGAANLNDMKDMLANLPQYQEQREKFSLHLNMAQECMAIFERDKLPDVATVEQNCATGLTAEGKTPKTLVEQMVPLLDSRDVVNMSKVRIIALYIQYRDGVPDEDRRRLYQHARLTVAEQDAVNALVYFGVRISRGPGDKDTKKKIKQKSSNEEEYELSRFKPLLHSVLDDHVNNRLDPTLFPYVKDFPSLNAAPSLRSAPSVQPATSLRSAKPSWHRPKAGGAREGVKQRVFVFVAGGMTYSEMREAYLLSKSLNRDIIVGSTHAVTPAQFVDDLKVLELEGIGSRALPNGLSESKGQRPLQDFYDEKYFTRDAPPPQRAPEPVAKTRSEHGRLHKPSINSVAGSIASSHSTGGKSEKEEKKKKRGLFHF
ncbi:Sec1-like protein [Laetiporus sulphureus 93-53]|uniref:Sec1-like protein n=1 Tax=Laetiporus sulphureus 93-53 TaxID=1314785 RepID=A0A165EKM2_9APHY|nr:Sec1-like protein [Laetiporus sulphureus 93-53]KZT07255.1 Sec1-like protein [Laetiporus sulphureus 93-53]